ncbi:3-oxoacyl-[acyl-carrier-protein] synthase [Ascosphaera pollenicola]|nr:3-oxoacyl-[acyl-carrier-protein] synthase [Ascosphaera pollenicola]
MSTLIDGDFASNHGGWGFSSSTGVDPQPYFRIFNPVSQSEKFDPNGDYIRHWVPELAGIKSPKAIHDPYHRGAGKEAERNGYPRPIVDHAKSREKALALFRDMAAEDGELRKLSPSPVEDEFVDLEANVNAAETARPGPQAKRSWWNRPGLGLSGGNWDSWLTSIQKYSTIGPSIFLGLHLANTSIIPLVTRSIPESESYLLLTREIYQAPGFEHAILTVPVIAHVLSGTLRRALRQRRHNRLFGTAPGKKSTSLKPSLQGKFGYALVSLLGTHALINRVVPLYVDGGSSSVGLGYVSYGLQKAPWSMSLGYIALVGATAWHVVGGTALYFGWRNDIGWLGRSQALTGQKSDRDSAMSAPQYSRRRKPRTLRHPAFSSISLSVRRFADLVPHMDQTTAPIIGGLSSIPAQGQIIQHDGITYHTVKEGQAYILTPQSSETTGEKGKKSGTKLHTVFYNPIQQFNRDLSVLAIRAFGEHVIAEKKKHLERSAKRQNLRHGMKRKRDDNQDGDQPSKHEDAAIKQDALIDSEMESGEKTRTPKFSILDALSATGLRALRYAKEISFATKIVANDLSGSAIAAMKLNITHNGVGHVVEPSKGDACTFMYKTAGIDAPASGKFDVIDLDPYGTAAPFLDAAVQAVSNGGLLCVTCTDAGVFASNGYPEKAFALYGGVTMKGPHSHEGGLRLILNALATSAAKYGLAIEPLLSLSIDFYARVFVRIHASPNEVKFLATKSMVVYNCDSGCGAWKTQPLGAARQKKGKKDFFYQHGYATGPKAGPTCDHCGFKTHLAGPMWAGPLHNPMFIKRIADLLPGADKDTYQTTDRIEGMLSTALEEDLFLDQEPDTGCSAEFDSFNIPRTNCAKLEPFPFFFIPSFLSKIIHTQTPPEYAFRGALKHLGYRSTRSHAKPGSIRTDAPWEVIWEIVREWARQKAPIREEAIRPGTPGYGIMQKDRERLRKQAEPDLDLVKKNIAQILEQKELIYDDMKSKILSELGCPSSTKAASNDEVSIPMEPDTSKLEVVFDEALGKAALASQQQKKLVRYQMNPKPNWGPISRADAD